MSQIAPWYLIELPGALCVCTPLCLDCHIIHSLFECPEYYPEYHQDKLAEVLADWV